MVDEGTYSATFATEEEAAEWAIVTRGRVVGARRAKRVSTAETAMLLEQVGADTSEAVADQVRATLRELFADAVDERLLGRSPVPAAQRAAASSPHGDIYCIGRVDIQHRRR